MTENRMLSGVFVALSLATMPTFAVDRSQDMPAHVIIAGEDGAAIRPHVVKTAHDGAIILAGEISATKSGWAAKLSADHTVAWTYTAPLGKEDQTSELRNTLAGPQFNDVVSMPDGTVFLCGKTPHSVESTQSTALLTHLDQQGGLIAERMIDIQSGEKRLRFSIDACALFHDRILALAHESHFPPPGAKSDAAASFALLLLDRNFNIGLNQHFNFLESKFVPVSSGSGLIVLKDAFVAIFTNNISTEIAAFSSDGNLIAHKSLQGRYVALQGSERDHVRLYGASEVGGGGKKTIVTFDRALNEVAQISGDKPASFVPERIFELPDHAFAMFGSQINAYGDRLTSSARLVGKAMTGERSIDFLRQGFSDGGTVLAASPTARQGEFAIARPYAPEGASMVVQRGVVVDYLNF
jgi:hypothetical protein